MFIMATYKPLALAILEIKMAKYVFDLKGFPEWSARSLDRESKTSLQEVFLFHQTRRISIKVSTMRIC
jgi:hypothetical protein